MAGDTCWGVCDNDPGGRALCEFAIAFWPISITWANFA
jgi:hypothetical protein